MPASQGPQATVPDPDVDSAGSFLDYLYIVSQYTVRLMTPCVWRILCLRNSSSVPYFRQPPNLPLQHDETESGPNVVRLLSAETECPPKVPICPHSAPKPKPKFSRLLLLACKYYRNQWLTANKRKFGLSMKHAYVCLYAYYAVRMYHVCFAQR